MYTKRTEIYSAFRRTLQIQGTTFESGDMNRQTFVYNYETDNLKLSREIESYNYL